MLTGALFSPKNPKKQRKNPPKKTNKQTKKNNSALDLIHCIEIPAIV
jgi:hypothetical protein